MALKHKNCSAIIEDDKNKHHYQYVNEYGKIEKHYPLYYKKCKKEILGDEEIFIRGYDEK